jgi:Domain of Unknown Function (DUF928)
MVFIPKICRCRLVTTCLTTITTLSLLAPTFVGGVTPKDLNEVSSASFEPPPRKDAPRSGTAGGGSRPAIACAGATKGATTKTLTALSPGKHVGLSHKERPVFFVYLPKTSAQEAEFSLFDAKMNGIYQTNMSVANTEGVIAIQLPSAPSLAKNQPYYWSFALTCNPDDRTEDLVVGGWVEHTQLTASLQEQLLSSTAVERISLYAKNGYWYDAVATIIELQHTQPKNSQLAQTWNELLTSVGLNLNVIATAN